MVVPRNILALDVGEHRIGLAVANINNKLAKPLKTILNTENTFAEIQAITEQEGVTLIVVGLPRNLNGEDTAQTKFVRDFKDKLKDHLGIEILFEDEALSSVRAKEALDHSSRPYKKEDIDSMAAAYILEDFLLNQSNQL